jgi:HSP20 family molecular chaperone IbpA
MVLPDQAKAKFEQGVLEIRIPKAAEAQSAQKVNVD